MDRIRQYFQRNKQAKGDLNRQPQTAAGDHVPEPAAPRARVDTGTFAKAVVQEYGETLVLLGKE